jgi:hypothetical protein
MTHAPTSVRLPVDLRDRLASRALANSRSLNSEIVMMLKDALEPDPVHVVIRECHTPHGTFYAAALGESPDDFVSAEREGEVYEAVIKRLRMLGPNFGDVRIEHRVERLG